MNTAAVRGHLREVGRNGLGAPLLLLLMLAMMVLPLPAALLDLLFTFNISLALVVLLAGVYARRPLDFSSFPTILLLATLMRLALNVASTRVVLLEGHTGSDAAGKVIQAFGEFVIGGNYAVGLVVFFILVLINFVVVTKGATRISEVSARFTLDAMPGKQMAIDADLNAGLIDQEEARLRREEVMQEADFYGSMDGAGKFVRGDAIAGILILLINVAGGLAVGLLQHDLSFSEAARNYTLLTIGDGLVAQIPSLVLSTAAGILVTRVSHAQDMGSQILAQLFKNPKSLAVVAVVLGSMGLIPGMPNLAFLGLALLCGFGVWWLGKRQKAEVAPTPPMAAPSETPELSWEDIPPVDPIGLEVGYRLIPLVDKTQGGQLMGRIKGVRKKLSQDWGFLIPPVHIRDNLNLAPIAYRITLFGVTVGEAEVFPEREMAINPGQVFGKVEGTPAQDPAFGLEALWIEPAQREQAQMHGYTVVDAGTVIATHLSQILQNHAHGLLGREEVQKLLENLAKTAPKLVEGLVPEILPLSIVQKVLQQLLEEGVPIRDMRTIVESLTEHGLRSQDPAILTAIIRIALGRFIIQCFNGLEKELQVISIAPALEQLLLASLQTASEGGGLNMEPGLAEKLHLTLRDSVQRQEAAGKPAILLVQGVLRPWLARFVRHAIPELKVLSYNEIPEDKQVRIVASVGS
ncbi:Flagellar biosynthesis protein FlhA [Nitrosococcus oceani ATCC 19707]|uniref:Flagellar biosynthesis protein FlhA n=2 Tax=Nitrosococcus oceani TaxID=1229 RepID=Q3J978_NITOC|nr:flagellar biosynthesis protein FlhA [Nitrosococcus oceani]ABA58618.1 Flagellar biosynthesis protein FlhA [Nitrosococcus oceani ATCC 19707]EDZ68413.1 flagellar biosynthesis protein FlhA [Nitrosococcus oceani AFC27]KFI18919.1 flagellar biosynthesis protein FlhA [Nitrosococcus oceani C-27]GEM19738.1 flagellar biosynthesis protein FlhA [Nitrosococcus oceani]